MQYRNPHIYPDGEGLPKGSMWGLVSVTGQQAVIIARYFFYRLSKALVSCFRRLTIS